MEFCFDYEPVYPRGVTRGDPDSICFHIIEGKMGMAQQHDSYMGRLHSSLITKYGLQPMEWERLSALIYEGLDLTDELARLDRLIEEKQPDNVHAYATEVLYRWLKEHQASPELSFDEAMEVKEEPVVERPYVQPMFKEKWAFWMQKSRERLGEEFYKTYMECCDLWAVRDKKVLVSVPNDFVREKWEEHIGEIISYFFTAFGQDRTLAYYRQDL